MALGKTNRVGSKASSLKLATKRNGAFLPRPEWEVQLKQADGKYKPLTNEEIKAEFGVEGPLYDVAGDLIGIEARQTEYEDSPIYNITLNLHDRTRNEIYFTGFTVGSTLGRKLANAILNLKAFEDVQVGLYNQINRETKKVYGAAAVRQGNDTVTIKGKFDFKTDPNLQPRVFEGKGGKPEKDWTKVDIFLFEQLKAFGETVKASKSSVPQETQQPKHEEPAYAPSSAPASQEEDESVPF